MTIDQLDTKYFTVREGGRELDCKLGRNLLIDLDLDLYPLLD